MISLTFEFNAIEFQHQWTSALMHSHIPTSRTESIRWYEYKEWINQPFATIKYDMLIADEWRFFPCWSHCYIYRIKRLSKKCCRFLAWSLSFRLHLYPKCIRGGGGGIYLEISGFFFFFYFLPYIISLSSYSNLTNASAATDAKKKIWINSYIRDVWR